MFNTIRDLLRKQVSSETYNNKIEEDKLKVAACALLLEIANADGMITDTERKKVVSVMKKTFNVEDEYVNELMELAVQSLKDSVSIYEFTPIINSNFTRDEKFELLKNLWKLIYADGTLDKYEDHLVRRIAGNLKLEHRDIVEAKLAAKE